MNSNTISKFLLFFIVFCLLSCKSKVEKKLIEKNPPSIEITQKFEDSISIRALDYGNGKYWFAGSKGKFGHISQDTGALVVNQIEIENDLEFRSISVTSSFTYILTAGNPAVVYKISHSNDNIELVYSESGENVFYDSMKFWNDNDGIAMGDPQNGCFSVIKTTDAGNTWTKIDCSKMPAANEGEAAFAASNSNLAIQNDNAWLVSGGTHARVFHSKDRGENWEVFSTPIIAGEQMTGIYAVDFYDANLGVIIGGDWNKKDSKQKNKAITLDGGKTWELFSDKSGPGYCSDIIFIPETNGQELLAVGTPGIWWSGNQGQEWVKLYDDGYYTVKMINSTDGYLAGRGKISKFSLER